MSTTINTRIKQRIDSLENWSNASAQILLNGELAVVVLSTGDIRFKIGDGKSPFSSLPYVGNSQISAISEKYAISVSNELSNYYTKVQTNALSTTFREGLATTESLTAYQLKGDYLLSSNLSFSYNSANKKIYLSAQGAKVGEVDCVDFIKDGMLSTAALVGNTLVLTFNTDAGAQPISVDLSKFVDNYDDKINSLSNAISSVAKDYTTSAQASAIANIYATSVDNKLASYYKKTETSSSSEIANSLTSLSNILSTYTDTVVAGVAAEIPTKVSELENDSGYLTAHQSLTAYETKDDLTSNYYTKVQTNALSTTFRSGLATTASLTAYQPKGDYLSSTTERTTSAQVSAIAEAYAKQVSIQDYTTSAQASAIANDYASAVEDQLTAYQPKGDYLLSSNLSFSYSSTNKKIYLYAQSAKVGEVDCVDFIKDGMLSNATLVGNTLILTFNTDAGQTPISVDLSKFVDNYDDKINGLSNAISSVAKDYTTSSQASAIANAYASVVDSKLTGYYLKSETSSDSQLKTEFAKYQLTGDYRTGTQISAIAEAYATSVDNKLANYYTKTQTNALSTTFREGLETVADLTSNYYKKTETSSVAELETAFSEKSKVIIRTWED